MEFPGDAYKVGLMRDGRVYVAIGERSIGVYEESGENSELFQ